MEVMNRELRSWFILAATVLLLLVIVGLAMVGLLAMSVRWSERGRLNRGGSEVDGSANHTFYDGVNYEQHIAGDPDIVAGGSASDMAV